MLSRVVALKISALILFIFAILPCPLRARIIPEGKNVLIIHSYHSGLSWTNSVMDGIQKTFENSGYFVRLSAEYLDALRFPDPANKRKIEALIISKAERTNPDLVIVSDNEALNFILKNRKNFFPNIPVVFCGINDFLPAMISGYRGITGVSEEMSVVDTVNIALSFHPRKKNIIVIGRKSIPADKHNWDSFVSALSDFPFGINVSFWDDLSVAELSKRIQNLDNNAILFLNGLIADESGRPMMYRESTKWISERSSAPTYSLWEVYLGFGIVGGKLISGYRQGELAAGLALHILRGENVDKIPVVSAGKANRYMFDYKQLVKFDIPLSKVPADSIVINQPDSLYHKYKYFVWTTLTVIAILGALVVFLSINIMRRRKAEESLLQANLVVEKSPAVLFRWDGTWKTVYVSNNITQFGYTVEEFLSGSLLFSSIIYPDDLENISNEIQLYLETNKNEYEQEYRISTKDGNIVWIDDHSKIERNEEGQVTHYQSIILDITDRKKTEEEHEKLMEQLFQSQKMESIGLLAGGVAHDFNNLLTPILGYSELLIQQLNDDSPNRKMLEQILQAANLARSLTRRLLTFGRKQILELNTVDVGSIIKGFEQMLRRTIRENIEININIEPSLGMVSVDTGQIEQAVLNLAVNAQDAMPKGGTLTIEVKNIILDAAYTANHPDVIPGKYIMLSVSDTGSGMSKEIQDHIFEPFFTTKETGKGTGLGLATVYGIVKKHGGTISVYSKKDHGTIFKMYLPIIKDTEIKIEENLPKPDLTAIGDETILLVEDNESVRALTGEMLTNLGYNVLSATHVENCIEIVGNHTSAIDLLLTDVIMPSMNGRELYDQLKKKRPEMKVLFMSGYTGSIVNGQDNLDGSINFLQKPFTLQVLSQKIREALKS